MATKSITESELREIIIEKLCSAPPGDNIVVDITVSLMGIQKSFAGFGIFADMSEIKLVLNDLLRTGQVILQGFELTDKYQLDAQIKFVKK